MISNPELLECLGNQTAFYDLYIKRTNHAIDAYVKAGRRKFAVKLHGSLAALDVSVINVVPLAVLRMSPLVIEVVWLLAFKRIRPCQLITRHITGRH